MNKPIRVTIWNEFRHEREMPAVGAIYPEGIHGAIAACVAGQADMTARTAVLDDPEHGLTDEVLAATDVLVWWGHAHHGLVRDEIVNKVYDRVLQGMGLIVLHSGHGSKIFRKLMGTDTQNLKWREIGEKERLWTVEPDALVFISWFTGGEVFRSGCCFQRSCGKIFYFRPGHETFPVYHQPVIQRVLLNAIRWAAPVEAAPTITGLVKPLETI